PLVSRRPPPSPLFPYTTLFRSRRSYHSFFYGALGQLRIDTIGGVDAVGANGQGGRGAQPVAMIGSRVQWAHPINASDAAFLKTRSEEHTSELQSLTNLVCRLLL